MTLAKALSSCFAVISCLLFVATALTLFVFRTDILVPVMLGIFAVATAFSAFMYSSAGN